MNLTQQIFSASPLPQVLVDPLQDRILLANSSAEKILWSDSGCLIKKPFSLFFAGLFPELITLTQEVLEKGKAWYSDLTLRSPNGNEHCLVDITGFLTEVDDIQAITFYFQDKQELDRYRDTAAAHQHYLSGISQWRRVEKVFQEIEKDNQLILTAAGEGIYGVDSEGRTTFVNPAAEALLGWSADELVGKDIHGLIHHSHESGCHYPSNQCPIYAAFCDGIVHRVVDEVFWHKQGNPIPVEYTSTPIKDNGHLVGAVVVFRDVTQQKNSQKELLGALREIESLKQRLEQENEYLQEEIKVHNNYQGIVGKSSAIQHVIHQIDLVAPTDATVLITGESGTGKELIARAIHEASERSQRTMIRVNCAAIPRGLFESEFFGHVKGAFTGAIKERIGRFELADGGTIFLDEVGEIPLEQQSKLLRVLQEQQFERVGEEKTRRVDVRVIAATNQNLKSLVSNKQFREDLFFRLNVFPIESISLRERKEDIPLLTMHFLEKSGIKFNKSDMKVSVAQINHLLNYDWPGNIRELENVIERQMIVAQGNQLVFDHFPLAQPQITEQQPVEKEVAVATDVERKQQLKLDIIEGLKFCKGKIYGEDGAAAMLGLKPTTLASRIKKYGINIAHYKNL